MKELSKASKVTELMKASGGGDEPKVTNELRTGWNDFLNFLDKKGVRGNPDLDKGGAGYKLLDEYIAANPKSPIKRETLPLIRKEILNYRNWALSEQKKPETERKVRLEKGVDDTNFMRHVVENEKTSDPNYPGLHLTSTKFPDSFLQTFMGDQLVSKENKGFANRL